MATRTGKVILAKGIRLDKSYKNVLSYSESDMVNLVTNHKVAESSNCSFTRVGENDIKIQVPYGDAIKCNYIAFQNPDYSNKWFFGFIDEVIYVANDTTRIKFTIDEYSTWKDYWTNADCFILREHVNDDTIGVNTVPENVETGEYEIVDLKYASMYESGTPADDFSIVFCVSKLVQDSSSYRIIREDNNRVAGDIGYIGGVFSSLTFFAVKTVEEAQYVIDAYGKDPNTKSEAIVNMYIVPSCCVNYTLSASVVTSLVEATEYTTIAKLYPLYNYYQSDTFFFYEPDVLAENYHPVNQKLFTYPFSYFFVTNNAGESVDFKYEDFPNEPVFSGTEVLLDERPCVRYTKYLVPSASVSGKIVFNKYKSYISTNEYPTKMNAYGITFAKIPVCAWTTDYYTNWLTQNGVNVALDLAKSAAAIGVGFATGGLGMAAGGLSAINSVANAIAQHHQATVVPPQTHGDINTGDFGFAFSRNIISFYQMSIRPEFARIIDNYFTLKGYAVNRLGIPNESGRPHWNYVQIGSDEIVGYSKNTASVPAGSMDVINTIYRNGVTIWHNHDEIGNYALDNSL